MDTTTPATRRRHTILIRFTPAPPGGTDGWSYTIQPPQADPKRARIKKRDELFWRCDDGRWTVFFKGLTPLETQEGIGIASVSAESGVSAGGLAATKPRENQAFTYGVKLVRPNGETKEDDPEIIIEAE